MASTSDVVSVGGVDMPCAALYLAIDLELKGCRFHAHNGVLRVTTTAGERPMLTDAETAAIRQYKPHLLHLVAFCVEQEGSARKK